MQSAIHHLIYLQFKHAAALPYNAEQLSASIYQRLIQQKHGDLPRWHQALKDIIRSVPEQAPYRLNQPVPSFGLPLSQTLKKPLYKALQTYIPWRKGPLNIHGIMINSEWRSDFKWRRIAPYVNLHNASVLDIGCANGYLSLRMLGSGAKHVVGVEPSLGAWFQYLSATRSCSDLPFWFINLPFEALPENVQQFDFIFSLGVIYHRKSPIAHLEQIKQRLAPSGKLILEALTLPEDYEETILIPEQRYCQMKNVWHVPKISVLIHWLESAGFRDIQLINTSLSTPAEQRSTQWMRFHSLPQYLHPYDKSKTIECYPAPRRSILLANNSVKK